MAILGTPARPAIVRVATLARAEAVREICASKGWRVIAGVEPDAREDLTDLELLLMGGQAIRTKVDRNAPCPCGSGKKHKKCCLGAPSPVEALLATAVAELTAGRPGLLEGVVPYHNQDFHLAQELDLFWAWLNEQPWKQDELERAFAEFRGDHPQPTDPEDREASLIRFAEYFQLDRPLPEACPGVAGLTPLAASAIATRRNDMGYDGSWHPTSRPLRVTPSTAGGAPWHKN